MNWRTPDRDIHRLLSQRPMTTRELCETTRLAHDVVNNALNRLGPLGLVEYARVRQGQKQSLVWRVCAKPSEATMVRGMLTSSTQARSEQRRAIAAQVA